MEYPDWALAVLALLIIFATLPVPVGFIHAFLQKRNKQSRDAENGHYRMVNTEETAMTDLSALEHRNGDAAPVS